MESSIKTLRNFELSRLEIWRVYTIGDLITAVHPGKVEVIGELLVKFGELEIPQEIIDAKENGNLVIFAGAGVSAGPPSNLPLFENLAAKIGAGTKFPRDSNSKQSVDRYLGVLESLEVKVRHLAQKLLTNGGSAPTALHKALCRISGSHGDKIRIITTNFDSHFSKCLVEEIINAEEFHAPALPLGHSFEGLAYLHGSLSKDLSRLVITDSDFGKAYLIDGWATRFLKDIFLKYTVLFVGYSHDDPVMSYIARGLPPESYRRRFILTHEHGSDKWSHLGIVPIPFSLSDQTDRFSKLTEGLEKWAKHLSESFMDKELRIQEIVSKEPSIDPEISDFILHSLKKSETSLYFRRHCKNEDWLSWCDEKGLLDRLFDPDATLLTDELEISHWVSFTFAAQKPYSLMKIVLNKMTALNPSFWNNLAFAVHCKKQELPSRVFAAWIAILLSKMVLKQNVQILEYLLNDCDPEKDYGPACQLLSFLTTPQLKFGQSFFGTSIGENPTETKIELALVSADPYWLPHAWSKIFKPNLDKYGDYLFPLFLEKVESAYSYFTMEENQLFDSMSRKRPSIAIHHQNHSGLEGFDNLFDFFADVLEWIAKNRPNYSAQIMDFISQPRPLFKRFALFIATRSDYIPANKRLLWILE